MIGDNYWSTGITLQWREPLGDPNQQWSATMQFLDDGFCDELATEGKLATRYMLGTAAEALDLLKGDAERLGIQWWAIGDDGPMIYYENDGENPFWPPPPGLFDILTAEATRLGWSTYNRDYWSDPPGKET